MLQMILYPADMIAVNNRRSRHRGAVVAETRTIRGTGRPLKYITFMS